MRMMEALLLLSDLADEVFEAAKEKDNEPEES